MARSTEKWDNFVLVKFGKKEFLVFKTFNKQLRINYIGGFRFKRKQLNPTEYLARYTKGKKIKEFEQIGAHLGVSAEQAMEIYKSAIEKFKKICDKKPHLKECLLSYIADDNF